MSLKIADPSIVRVENSFKQLATAAQALNNASDDLGKVIRHLDAALKKLALGVTAWVQVNGTSDETQYWASEIGYVKIDGKWCIALREVSGYLQDNSDEAEETWSFSEAPRSLRAEAVSKIPDLLEKMLQQTEEATKDLKEKTEQAAELTFLVSNLVPNIPAPTPQTWHRPATGSAATAMNKNKLGAQNGDASPAARFRESEAFSTERPAAPASAPAAGSSAQGASPVTPNGRFREVEGISADRPAGVGRVLPTERVS